METLTRGSFLAVLRDGRHVGGVVVCRSWGEFRAFVAAELGPDRDAVEWFVYAYGREHQEYTPAEVLEVFFGSDNP